ncbi:OSCAR protein, partial [Chauna torquata]|nr:OSCAR protein [Chauna torquata]
RPSLSLHPSKGVALGDNVTLQCHLPWPALWVLLYQDGHEGPFAYKHEVQDAAEFSFRRTDRGHAGTYRCQYQVSGQPEMSELSDPVELVVTDQTFPRPGTSLRPKGRVGTGTNVTIQCWTSYDATFLLHKGGCSAPTRSQVTDRGDLATFTLPEVTPA